MTLAEQSGYIPLAPEVSPVGVSRHVVNNGRDGGHDPLVGGATVEVRLCEDHREQALVLLFCRGHGGTKKVVRVKLVVDEPTRRENKR